MAKEEYPRNKEMLKNHSIPQPGLKAWLCWRRWASVAYWITKFAEVLQSKPAEEGMPTKMPAVQAWQAENCHRVVRQIWMSDKQWIKVQYKYVPNIVKKFLWIQIECSDLYLYLVNTAILLCKIAQKVCTIGSRTYY